MVKPETSAAPATTARTASARERIARLRVSFVAQLPARVELAQSLFERLQAKPDAHAAVTELHRVLHGLKGTGRSFGFAELGSVAGLGEDLAASLLDSGQTCSQAWQLRMAEQLARLKVVSAALSVAKPPEGCDADLPAFNLPLPAAATVSTDRLVYICDDETLTQQQLAIQLGCFGYETRTFSDPEALQQAVLARRPAAIVMDIGFPQGRDAGTRVMTHLRQALGVAIPTIFLSARDDFAARLAAVQAGGVAYFHKPARAIELVTPLDQMTRQQQPAPIRILIIDDEPEVADYHSIILTEAGMQTARISEPARVLEELREFRPDIVLMDMYMPACNGRDLAMLIRQVPDYVGLPIVYLSSETDKQKQFSAMRVGAEGFLTKPVVPDELVAAVTIRAERMRTLRALMARDSLTGLFNHTTTTQLLEIALANAKRAASSLCFAMIDIDLFKSVNDTHGHAVGDQVILAIARVLQQRLRNSDVVGRYGGEEFAVILHDVSIGQAVDLIDQLRRDFARLSFHSVQGDFSCTFSAGIACYPVHQRLELLRESADKALYEAKRAGRNQVLCDDATRAATA